MREQQEGQEEVQRPERRGWGRRAEDMDANRLSFSLRLVIELAVIIVGIVATTMATNWSMRSDLRDVSTRMEFYQRQYTDLRTAQVEQSNETKRELRMIQISLEEIQLALARKGIPIRGNN